MIIINFKTYKEATGDKAYVLAKKISKISNKNIMLAVQATDIFRLKELKIPLLAQNVSPLDPGKNTGFITPFAIKKAGAQGTLVNHAEHKLKHEQIKNIIKKCKSLKLKTVVCVKNLKEAKEIKKLNPDFIAYEEPKLISTGKSITQFKTKKIKEFSELFKKTRIVPLCGAGISNKKDVEEALKLGLKGVLISSAIVKSKKPDKILKTIIEVMK